MEPLQSFASWWNSRRERTESTLSRSEAVQEPQILRIAVVEEGRQILESQVIRPEAAAGVYFFDLCIGSTDELCGKSIPIAKQVSWIPGSGKPLPFVLPAAGIHLPYRLEADDHELRTGDRALVVVATRASVNLIQEATDKINLASVASLPDVGNQRAIIEDYVRFLSKRLTSR